MKKSVGNSMLQAQLVILDTTSPNKCY